MAQFIEPIVDKEAAGVSNITVSNSDAIMSTEPLEAEFLFQKLITISGKEIHLIGNIIDPKNDRYIKILS